MRSATSTSHLLGKLVLTPTEFASLLGRHYTWTYRQIYAGKVRVISNLGRIMIPRTEVDRLLQARRRTTERNSPIRRSRARKPVTVPASAEFFRRGWLAPPRESWGGCSLAPPVGLRRRKEEKGERFWSPSLPASPVVLEQWSC